MPFFIGGMALLYIAGMANIRGQRGFFSTLARFGMTAMFVTFSLILAARS